MPRTLSAPLIALLLVTVQLGPPLPQYLDFAQSMALGAISAAAVLLLVCLLNDLLSRRLSLRRTGFVDATMVSVVAAVTALVVLHAIVADLFQPIELARFAQSLAPLALVLGGGIAFGRALSCSPDGKVDRAVRISFWVLCALMVLHFAKLQPRGDVYSKSTFPFTETSHFALAFTPVLLYRCVSAQGRARLWWLAAAFIIAMLLQSLALLAGCLLAAIACRRLLLAGALSLALLLVGLPIELAYYTDRLNFSGNVVNLSNVVYIEGWQLLLESLTRSSGWGVGFQQLGVHGSDTTAADLVRQLSGGIDLNIQDGSFVLAKLGSEFGAVGLLLTILYLMSAARCMRKLRAGGEDSRTTFARCIVVAYAVDMFVRGPGYFTESTLLFVVAVSALMMHRGLARTPGAARNREAPPAIA